MTVGEPFHDNELGAICRESEAGLLLCQPIGPGPVRERLHRYGEGPFLCDLTGMVALLLTPEAAAGGFIRIRPAP